MPHRTWLSRASHLGSAHCHFGVQRRQIPWTRYVVLIGLVVGPILMRIPRLCSARLSLSRRCQLNISYHICWHGANRLIVRGGWLWQRVWHSALCEMLCVHHDEDTQTPEEDCDLNRSVGERNLLGRTTYSLDVDQVEVAKDAI